MQQSTAEACRDFGHCEASERHFNTRPANKFRCTTTRREAHAVLKIIREPAAFISSQSEAYRRASVKTTSAAQEAPANFILLQSDIMPAINGGSLRCGSRKHPEEVSSPIFES